MIPRNQVTEPLRVNIEARVPLDRPHEALGLFADGTLGKVRITPAATAGAGPA